MVSGTFVLPLSLFLGTSSALSLPRRMSITIKFRGGKHFSRAGRAAVRSARVLY